VSAARGTHEAGKAARLPGAEGPAPPTSTCRSFKTPSPFARFSGGSEAEGGVGVSVALAEPPGAGTEGSGLLTRAGLAKFPSALAKVGGLAAPFGTVGRARLSLL
jgi:hypothetical protein